MSVIELSWTANKIPSEIGVAQPYKLFPLLTLLWRNKGNIHGLGGVDIPHIPLTKWLLGDLVVSWPVGEVVAW